MGCLVLKSPGSPFFMGKAMADINIFCPGPTVTLSATTTTGRVAFGVGGRNVQVYNAGSSTVFIKFGNETVVATASDMPVPAGAILSFDRGFNTNVAGITSAGTATAYFTVGDGI
jgi:hypothetical protein